MKNTIRNSVKNFVIVDNCCTFAHSTTTYFYNYKNIRSSSTTIVSINNNIPSRLTPVAHLGGFSLKMGL